MRGTSRRHDRIRLLISSGRYEAAVRCCDDILKNDPNDTVAQDCRDRALEDVEKANEKLRQSEENLRDDPGDFSSMLDKGMALMQLGRVGDAVDLMDGMLEDDPDDCDVMYAKAAGLALNGKLGKARKCSKLLLKTCPEHYCPTPISSFMQLGEAANMVERDVS